MSLYTKVCFVILGYFFSSIIVLNTCVCKKLDGYKFPVYSTEFCPGNESEWNKRSSALKCNETNGYMCLPNGKLTELLEFCFTKPFIWIEEGVCLSLEGKGEIFGSYSCSHFIGGCHNNSFQSSRIFDYPACITIGNGCFLANQSCKSSSNGTSGINKDDCVWVLIVMSIIVVVSFSSFMLYVYRKRKFSSCKRGNDLKNTSIELEELNVLIADTEDVKNDNSTEPYKCIGSYSLDDFEEKVSFTANDGTDKKDFSYEASPTEKGMFNQWKQDDFFFISTKACKEVEKNIESRNLVIVTGHSGSGKSAIIQHIALKYREQGWVVKRVKKVEDIVNEYSSGRFQKNKTICVFNDPFGKESFDEILNNSWQTYEEELELYLKTAKLIMSCRNHIISDTRLTRFFVYQSHIVDIDDNKNKLTVDEKQKILTKYTIGMNLSDKDCDKIVEVETYFPLLCKLYSNKDDYEEKGINFFTEPVTVLTKEIRGFRSKDKGKYCALALLVLFHNDICVSDLLKDSDTEKKFQHTLKLCGLPENTSPAAIGDYLNSLKGCFVKTIGDTYQFNHDFVMEVTTQVFGTDYPAEIIKYADIGFLRRRVRLGDSEIHNDSFNIYLSKRYIKTLGERIFTELFEERFLDVVLNPCLRNEKIIEVLKEKIAGNPESIHIFLKRKKVTIDKQELDHTPKNLLLTKLSFLNLENLEVSPLFALIAFCHTQISQYCLNILQQMHNSFKSNQIDVLNRYFLAMCCNGSTALFNNVFKDSTKEFLSKTWGALFPIHIVAVFHNHQLLFEMIKIGVDVNLKTNSHLTPLILAAGNDTQEHGEYKHEESGAERRDKTVQLLLSNGADINLCMGDNISPLYVACQYGHDSTVQLLLSKGADINVCTENGVSPFLIACQNGHDSTVQFLLSKGADINLTMEDGTSPLLMACQKGHDNTVQLLLSKGADINLPTENGISPLLIVCLNGHDSIVQLLLSNGADINLRTEGGVSPLLIACHNGHDSTVNILLSKGADINLCKNDGASPLYIACQKGHDSTVQLLLSEGADINLPTENGASPLHIACQNSLDSTVQLLLSNGADVNLRKDDGASPLDIAFQNGNDSIVKVLLNRGADINHLMGDRVSIFFIACQNGHNNTVQLLLSNGADINSCIEDKVSPLFIACQNGHDRTVQLLLSNSANINLCMEDGTSPLYIACQNGHERIVQLLLSNGADINLCRDTGASPLFIACQNGHDTTVQRLLSKGADMNLCKENKISPFSIACQCGHDTTVQLLLDHGADINLCNKDEVSPLYLAFAWRQYKTVNILLKRNADTRLFSGLNPSYLDLFDKNDSTIHFLLKRDNIQNNIYDPDSYFSLFVFCHVERMSRDLLRKVYEH